MAEEALTGGTRTIENRAAGPNYRSLSFCGLAVSLLNAAYSPDGRRFRFEPTAGGAGLWKRKHPGSSGSLRRHGALDFIWLSPLRLP